MTISFGLAWMAAREGRDVGGPEVAREFVALPFDHLLFTGSTAVGREVMRAAAANLTPVTLELGGKSPTVVLEDADLDLAVNGVIYGIFSSSGQACIAGARLFVHANVYEAFMQRLVAKTQALRVGHPEHAATQVGPLIDEKHLNSVDAYVRRAEQEGGQIVVGGYRLTEGDLAQGNYYAPTIIAGLGNRASVCQEEIFGPVLVVLPFEDEHDLLQQANDDG